MKLIEDYLKKDLKIKGELSWEEIRAAYAKRAYELIKNDWQAPSYGASLRSEAGRRAGKVHANVTDYTRDQHDLALNYEYKFVKEYLPFTFGKILEPFITNSGMAALSTIIVMLQREGLTDRAVLIGKHSYFQNLELVTKMFPQVFIFDETKEQEWQNLINKKKPAAIFVDSLCNEQEQIVPEIVKIAKYLRKNVGSKCYLVIDNSMLGYGFPWKDVLNETRKNLIVIGWESLNKYYQYGLDRTTGGVVWSYGKTATNLFYARLHGGTILPDVNSAMLPTPNKNMMKKYLARIAQNREIVAEILNNKATEKGCKILTAATNYEFNGAQIVIKWQKKMSYGALQRKIKLAVVKAKKGNLQLVAGSSFGMPSTRIYVTARKSDFAQMFLRISVGTEEKEEAKKIGELLASIL